MASLTLTIGTLTASVNANNTKASEVLSAYADAIGATGTNQQKADAVVLALVRHMQAQARARRAVIAQEDAVRAAQTAIDGLSWD